MPIPKFKVMQTFEACTIIVILEGWNTEVDENDIPSINMAIG
jgi:hypothetical protein